MLCQKCQKNHGVPYTFYYGKMVNKESTTIHQRGSGSDLSRTITYYTLGGHEEVVLCSKCLRGGFGFWVLVIGLLIIGLLLGYGLSSFLYFFLISLLAPFIIILAEFKSDLKFRGPKRAIEFRKGALMRQGFDVLWTPQEYAKLNRYIH